MNAIRPTTPDDIVCLVIPGSQLGGLLQKLFTFHQPFTDVPPTIANVVATKVSASPPLNPIERPWKILRWRTTHNRRFDTLADLRRSLRSSLSYFQTMRDRVRTLVSRQPRKRTPSAGS